jgi:hypothetical protein
MPVPIVGAAIAAAARLAAKKLAQEAAKKATREAAKKAIKKAAPTPPRPRGMAIKIDSNPKPVIPKPPKKSVASKLPPTPSSPYAVRINSASAKSANAAKKSKPLPPAPKYKLKSEPSSATFKPRGGKARREGTDSVILKDKSSKTLNVEMFTRQRANDLARSSKRGLKAANKPLSKGNAKRVAEIKESTRFPGDKKRATEAFRTQNSFDKKISPAQKALNKKTAAKKAFEMDKKKYLSK